jgi:type VI secretion system secreted protein VgrG
VTDDTPSPRISTLLQRHDATPVMAAPGIRNRGQAVISADAANHPCAGAHTAEPVERAASHRTTQSRHLQRQRCQSRTIRGRSDCSALRSGHLLQISEHPINAFNEQWLITELRIKASTPRSSIRQRTRIASQRFHRPALVDRFSPALAQLPNIGGLSPARVLGLPASQRHWMIARIGVSCGRLRQPSLRACGCRSR